ncbi:MAG: hypothetical protein LUD51_00600 [Clostridia bacterium]|nr:hypothetical protein [Clostridia bacterium]
MSAYLGFKKNGVTLTYFCRINKIVEFMGNPSSDDWEPYDVSRMHYAFEEAREEEQRLSEHEALLKETLHGKLDYDDIMAVVSEIKETREELDETRAAITYMTLLKEIFEEPTYKDHERIEPVIEWYYG